MNHDTFRLWLVLSHYGELDPLQKETLDDHLKECAACRAELGQLETFKTVLSERRIIEADDRLLQDARRQFRIALMEERSKRSIFGSIAEWVERFVPRPAGVALGAMALVAVGIAAGYAFFRTQVPAGPTVNEAVVEGVSSMQPGSRITNVRFSKTESRDGMIDLSFDAVMPVHLTGSMDDPRVQRILASVLMNSRNPGTRIRSANMLASETTPIAARDADVKEALISALETDENPGVRKEALEALQKLPYDKEIQDAYITVLQNDKNSAMRIGVINTLMKVRAGGVRLDSDVLTVLRKKSKFDDNTYIRARATSFLEGVQQ